MIICYSQCWPCMFGQHSPGWHTWADVDDIEHAAATGQPDPSTSRCGCYCAGEPAPDEEPEWEPLSTLPPCDVCGSDGACGYDMEGRPMIHTTEDDDR